MGIGWSAEQLKDAIDRGERQRVTAIANHEKPEKIDGMSKGLDLLHDMLRKAEREEQGHGRHDGDSQEH